MVFESTDAPALPHPLVLVPVFTLVLILSLYIPPFLVQWYRHAARFIG